MPAVTLGSLLAGLNSAQKHETKATIIAQLLNTGSFKQGNNTITISNYTTWTTNGVTISIVSARADGVILWIKLTASDANGSLPLADNGEYGFTNIPIRTYIRDSTGENDPGETIENVAGAVQEAIYQSVVEYAHNHGWVGG